MAFAVYLTAERVSLITSLRHGIISAGFANAGVLARFSTQMWAGALGPVPP